MPKQKKGVATTKNKARVTSGDLSLLDLSLKQKQLSDKIISKAQCQHSIKTIQTSIDQFEASIKEMNFVKITKNNVYEMYQKALELKLNLDTIHKKLLNLENTDLERIPELMSEEKAHFLKALNSIQKIMKGYHLCQVFPLLRKFLIGESVLQLEAKANRLQFMMDQIQKNKTIQLQSRHYFFKESDNIINKANELSKELSEFKNTIYVDNIKKIKKIAIDIKNVVLPPAEKTLATKSTLHNKNHPKRNRQKR